MNKKYFPYLVKLLITLGIFFALFKLVPYAQLATALKVSNKGYIVLGFFLFFVCNILGVLRWRFMLRALSLNVPVFEAFNIYFSGLFLNLFFPSFVAGDVFRAANISLRYGQGQKVATSVLMDRFSGLLALATIAVLAFIFGGGVFLNRQVILSMLLLWVLIFFFVLIVFSRKVFGFFTKVVKNGTLFKDKLIHFHDQLYFFRQHPTVLLKSMYFSLPIQLLSIFSFYASAKAFGFSGLADKFLIVVPIISTIATVPITVAGAGTREAASVYYFAMIGIGKTVGLSISLLNLAAIVINGIIGGIVYVGFSHRRVQPRA